MITIKKNIIVNTSVGNVYKYITDHSNEPEWLPGMVEVKDVTGSDVGDQFKWKYKMAGVILEGETEITELTPNKKMVTVSKGGAKSTFTFNLEPSDNGTLLDLTIDYTIPIPVLGKLAEKVAWGRNDREANLAMENIKEKLEG